MISIETARRYVAWLERHTRVIAAAHAVLLALAIYLIAFHLPLYADLSYLLPAHAPSVRDLREIERRVASKDTTIVLVQARDPATRAAAASAMTAGLARIAPDLIEKLEIDDAATREYIRAHRHLFVTLEALREAHEALAARIRAPKLAATGLFVEIDDDPGAREAQDRADRQRLDDLRAKRREAEARLDRSSHVSADGLVAMILVKTTFNTADVTRARRLLPQIEAVAESVRRGHPTVTIGLAGGTPTAVAEHGALVRGIALSTIITALLVVVVLWLLLRSAKLIALLVLVIAIAATIGIGITALTVGHLNAATAFLGAIIAGNGVNYGILLVARYLEERRRDESDAMARAVAGTLRPTMVAALGAAVAYGALVSTSFAGFRDFAVIGSVGMIVCWCVSYSLLPALILRFARGAGDTRESVFSRIVRLLAIRRSSLAVVVAGVVVVAAAIVTWRYVASDPFEYDMARLRSEARDAVAARDWMTVADDKFGRGIWTKTYILTARPEQVPRVLAYLRTLQAMPEGRATIGTVFSIEDVIPPDQPSKLLVLAEIRALLDEPGLDELEPSERAELRELRPPDTLAPIVAADLPPELVTKLVEIDGRLGTLILLAPPPEFRELDGRDLVRLAAVIEQLRFAIDDPDIRISGASMIFADVIETIQRDSAVVTAVASIGLVVMVILVVGWNRRSVAVLTATFGGALAMVAVCALIGIRVNFLDFIALPITLGLGIDYAINVADRASCDDPGIALATTGAAVLVCSLTTIIGYASLLVGSNLAIRGFGLASLVGEVTCVVTALTVVPAVVALGRAGTERSRVR